MSYNINMEEQTVPRGNLTNEQRKILSAQRTSMEVSPFEREAIMQLRKFTHGKFIIQVLDGIPIRYIAEVTSMFLVATDSGLDTISKTERSINKGR